LFDGLGEALGVEAGGFAAGAGLVHSLASVGDDRGDERTGPGDYPEGELHQVEEGLGVDLRAAVDRLDVQQYHQPAEGAARDQDRSDESEGWRPTDLPQSQLPPARIGSRFPIGCHDGEDRTRISEVAPA
jgi:hypothetical protein